MVGGLLAAFVQIDVNLAFVGNVGGGLVAVLLLYAPVLWAWRRNIELETFGFRADPVRRGLLLGLGVPLVIVPVFTVGYVLFYDHICAHPSSLSQLAPRGVCARFLGWDGLDLSALDWVMDHKMKVAGTVLTQLVVVALPEELFFRGFLLHKLELAFPPKHRILGGGIGIALVITSVLFALIHLPKGAGPGALATFFPGLLFGWMRSATGSILAGTLTHASSNLLVKSLDHIFLR